MLAARSSGQVEKKFKEGGDWSKDVVFRSRDSCRIRPSF